jgi:predicted alpha/beta hydrolase family esterase
MSSKEPECDIHIISESMAGFECDSSSNSRLSSNESLPMDVEGQINFLERMLGQHIKSLNASGDDEWNVILVAHSLGSYISLKLI